MKTLKINNSGTIIMKKCLIKMSKVTLLQDLFYIEWSMSGSLCDYLQK